MDKTHEYYTIKGYLQNENRPLTNAMEDYLEMICRILQNSDRVRAADLSKKLNVKPSSVSKMVQQLADAGYIQAEKYSVITVTEKGRAAGNYLLYRHNVIHNFLCLLNSCDNELEEAEKIEHFLSRKTVENLDRLTQKLSSIKEAD